jgi:hypothetical protein
MLERAGIKNNQRRHLKEEMGETPMGPTTRKVPRPDVAHEQRAACDLVKRIRKLRWMGMEEEAERLQAELRRSKQSDSVLAAPVDTD